MRGIFSKLNISKALLMRGLSLVVVFTTLAASYAALSLNKTLGWFAKNEKVTANGMITQAYTSSFKVTCETVTQTTDDQNVTTTVKKPVENINSIFTNIKIPGQFVTFDITIQNVGLYSVELTGLGFEEPDITEDIPKVEGSTSYYLSTELTVDVNKVVHNKKNGESTQSTELALATNADDTSTARPLRDSDNVSERINYFDWLSESSKVEGRKLVKLEPQESVTFTVTVLFVDRDDNQNVYKNFGDDGDGQQECCKRSLFITFDE